MNPRINRLGKIIDDLSLDAILVWNLTNVHYLSGFTGSEAALVVSKGKSFFITDSRYTTQASQQVTGFDFRISYEKITLIAEALKEIAAKRIGYEDETLTVSNYRQVSGGTPGAEFIPLSTRVDELRLHKDPEEIAIMRRSAWAAEVGLQNALAILRPGVTEMEVAIELETGMRRAGALKPSFDTIVGSGPRGALPHGTASDKVLEEGEMIVIDFGCILDGYCSDETVTVALGRVGGEERKVYEIVRAAQEAAIAALAPGVSLREVDKVARDYIGNAGFGQYFGHGLGHGVGLEIHEGPRVSTKTEAVAEPGMVVTIEPGIYLPGRFGVRIEDTLLVNESGCEKITSFDKSFRKI